jgi:hypothetical protein
MPITVAGLIDTEAMLARIDMDTKKRVTSKMYAKAVAIQQLAIKMAPIDRGNLEKAIKVRPETPGRARDEATGQFVRQEIEVYIDMKMPIPERPGKTIGDYAYEMHEHLTPAGPLKLGPLSAEKQSGAMVGGAFLTRAMDELAQGFITELAMDMFDG